MEDRKDITSSAGQLEELGKHTQFKTLFFTIIEMQHHLKKKRFNPENQHKA
jgi:hypothetical protein|tara:strand:+ start:95 stop:247 length:153 start_codon:yes stop_codon:yes gene_type:complete